MYDVDFHLVLSWFDMCLKTGLDDRLNNTNLHETNALLPLFDTALNYKYAIDERT